MDSPVSKFLDWYHDLPIFHQKRIAGFVSVYIKWRPNKRDFVKDSEQLIKNIDEQLKNNERLFTERIKEIIKADNKGSKSSGLGIILSLRSLIDFLLSYPDHYYFRESGFTDESQKAANSKEVKENEESQFLEICDNWEKYKIKFATNDYIAKWYSST